MIDKIEKTVPNVFVGADTEQSSQKCTANIITESSSDFNSFQKKGGNAYGGIKNYQYG